MTTVIEFCQRVARICAELKPATIQNPTTNVDFVEKLLESCDAALSDLSVFHKWEWLKKSITPTAGVMTLNDAISVTSVVSNSGQCIHQQLDVPKTGRYFIWRVPVLTIGGVSVNELSDITVNYESSISSMPRTDNADVPVPDVFISALTDLAASRLCIYHVNDGKRADLHSRSAASKLSLLQQRMHEGGNVYNRYSGGYR